MSDAKRSYWEESVSCSFDDAGIAATQEQIEWVAGDMESSHECFTMAFSGPPDRPAVDPEIVRLRRELEWERNAVACPICHGRGRIITNGPYHSSDSGCWKCNGRGKVQP